jgi:hypothetical protein
MKILRLGLLLELAMTLLLHLDVLLLQLIGGLAPNDLFLLFLALLELRILQVVDFVQL